MIITAVIPARLNSTRLPNKLLRDICGKSLIVRTYESAVNSNIFDKVLVVTNNNEITKELDQNNVNYFYKDSECETGTDRIADIASKIKADIIINVQGDEPFIKSKSLKEIIDVFKNDKDESIDVVSLMTPFLDLNELENRNNVKVFTDSNNNAVCFSRSPISYVKDDKSYTAYKHVGIYAFRKDALINFAMLKTGKLESIEKIEALRLIENNINIRMVLSKELFIGIDTEEDLIKAVKIICEKEDL